MKGRARIRCSACVVLASTLACAAAAALASPASAANLCVGSRPGCYSTLRPALAAAHDGDTIAIAAGTYAGGVTIDASVRIIGAGAGSTVVRGGGSVLTIGVYGASSEPTVSISGLTITGGVARSSPISTPLVGEEGVIAGGGGIEIPPGALAPDEEEFMAGATVAISNSIITGNLAAPTHALPLGPPCPGNVSCPFARAEGGGIDSWGTLTLANSTVSDNRIGSASGLSNVASDAEGGGIASEGGALTISNSTISGNQVSASAPNGRFAESGGLLVGSGTLMMSNSTVTGNNATLAAAEPNLVAGEEGAVAKAGGVHIEGYVTAATITNTTITLNSASMTNTLGDTWVFSGGLQTDGVFTLDGDVIADNSVHSAALSSSGDAEGDSGAGEGAGTIRNTRLTGNTVTVSSAGGTATASAGASIFTGTLTNSTVSENHVFASSPDGAVALAGGGLHAGGPLTLQNTAVTLNTGYATGRTGNAQGGGIFAVDESGSGGPPGGPLILDNSKVTFNLLGGGRSIKLQGGGIFATSPVTLANSLVAGNFPGQCDGC